MAYIPNNYKVTKEQFAEIYKNLGENDATWETLLMADYVFHHQDQDYDGGLSFFDRLHKKLGRFHYHWDIETYKAWAREGNDPVGSFISTVKYMLKDSNHVAYYGV